MSYFSFSQIEPSCDWDVTFTSSNSTIAIQQENWDNIYIAGTDITTSIMYIECPMWIGVFYQTSEGEVFQCAGYTQWDPTQSIAIAAWGDDPTTTEQDGFLEGDPYTFGLCIDGFGTFFGSSEMSTDTPFTDSYTTNGFGSVNSINFGPPVSDLGELISSCWNVGLSEKEETKILFRNVDMLGRDIDISSQSGFMIQIFSDNTFSKKYKF